MRGDVLRIRMFICLTAFPLNTVLFKKV